jgi:hypothetical protein
MRQLKMTEIIAFASGVVVTLLALTAYACIKVGADSEKEEE